MKKIIGATILIIGFLSNSNAQIKKKTLVAKTSTNQLATGKILYAKHCVACHQADGGGVMGLNPPLIKTDYVLGDKKRLINIILKGLDQEIEIDGETYANPMPGLSHLSDQEVADVLSYIRNNFGNKASLISPAEVKVIRATKTK
ncbi:cytochrome c [Pedobacter gandavensis]|uniref:c-type cytochrome n=1 Tax=Pedobacter gandavensis TaxID=2679963 RepID=UPI00292CDC16|nr:cytochrome c [Pedobacter gandavensis]